jgi:tetratricopeptide (TPR) repeat protein
MSVEAAIERDLENVSGSAPCGVAGPTAAHALLTALTWGHGGGLPDDVWAVVATALSGGVPYEREDVHWLLGVAGQYVVPARDGDTVVFRLAHPELVDHFRPARPAAQQLERDPEAALVARALVAYYQSLLASGIAPGFHHYLWFNVRLHCVDAGQPGIDLLRELAATDAAFVNDLAMSLTDLGVRYSEVGRVVDAVASGEEAVAVYRQRAAANPAFLGDLASSLTNLGIYYIETGRGAEAVATTEEAVAICRERAVADPAPLGDLASALRNLGGRYLEVGRRIEAVAPTEEAVTLYRELAAANPVFLRDLAGSSADLGDVYSGVGRRGESLAPTQEAVTL